MATSEAEPEGSWRGSGNIAASEPPARPRANLDGLPPARRNAIERRADEIWSALKADGSSFQPRQTGDDDYLTMLIEDRAAVEGRKLWSDGLLLAEHDYFAWELPGHPNLQRARGRPFRSRPA